MHGITAFSSYIPTYRLPRDAIAMLVANFVVDLDSRLYVQVTDCNVEDIDIEMPVELTFRRIHKGSGTNNYFWKARPSDRDLQRYQRTTSMRLSTRESHSDPAGSGPAARRWAQPGG